MNFLQFAVWGAYLTSMGRYLASAGMGGEIGLFYSIQGIVSIFMPALVGIVADRWIPAQKVLGICHAIVGAAIVAAGWYALQAGDAVEFPVLFSLYTLSVAFYMPTIALTNSVAYSALDGAGLDTVKHFPPIRVFGTVGFIFAMIGVNLLEFDGVSFQETPMQFLVSGGFALVLAVYSFTLPNCPVAPKGEKKSMVEALGLKAFSLFKQRKMAVFFIFSMLLGVSLQITNGFANPFLGSFGADPLFADTFGVKYSNILISLSQISETLCILLIPFALRKFGIKNVMLMAMLAWVFRFAFFGFGDPGSGVWLLVLSMLVYGLAFDFFNVSGALYVDKETDPSMRSSAQGLFMLMTNGFGATIGTLGAQWVVNQFCELKGDVLVGKSLYDMDVCGYDINGWSIVWGIFAAYSLVVMVSFAIIFKYKHNREEMKNVSH